MSRTVDTCGNGLGIDPSRIIGGGGNMQFLTTSPTFYFGSFGFDVLSNPGPDNTQCHVTVDTAATGPGMAQPFVFGSTQSTWPSEGGGTFTFTWTY